MTASPNVRASMSLADPDAPSSVLKPAPDGSLPTAEGGLSALDVTTATVIKASSGRSYRVSVIVAGSAAGTLNDCATTAAAGATNQIGTIPSTIGTYLFNWPHATGIVLVPGTGQTLAISYT